MTAGVHHADVLTVVGRAHRRLERNVDLLDDRKRVHVRSQSDHPPRLATAKNSDDAGMRDRSPHLDAELIVGNAQQHQRRRLILDGLEGVERLRVLVAEKLEVLPRFVGSFVGFFVGHGCASAWRSVRLRTTPERTTYRILRKFATSSDGSAPVTTRSPSFPFSIVPTCLSSPIARLAVAVEAAMTCIGVIPEACIASISA